MGKVFKISFVTFLLLSLTLSVKGQDFFASGEWLKFGVTKAGIHSISLAKISDLGLDVSNPENLALYGGQSAMFPQTVSENTVFSPEEVPFWFSNNSSQGDALYFHSSGPVNTILTDFGELASERNLFTDTIYYYLTLKESSSLKVEEISTNSELVSSDTLMAYQYLEKDEINLLGSGRQWFSDLISSENSSSEFVMKVGDFASEMFVKYRVVGSSSRGAVYSEFGTKDSVFSSLRIAETKAGYGTKARGEIGSFLVGEELVSDEFILKHGLNDEGIENAKLYLDYVSLNYHADHSKLKPNTSYYVLSNSQGGILLDQGSLNDRLLVKDLETGIMSVVTPLIVEEKYNYEFFNINSELVFFKNDALYNEPIFLSNVDNFSLTLNEEPELLIIYHSSLKEQADRLKAHKESLGLSTTLADVGHVIDQYGSGNPDVSAIRNFVKYVHQSSNSLKYLLILGDCSYDYKDRLVDNTNMIPVYQSRESFHNVQTFSSDDFYGFLSDSDGEWAENSSGNHLLDIAVGRIPANTAESAKYAVDKIVFYETDKVSASWKNNMIFVADDEDNALHVNQVNQLVERVQAISPFIRDKKIYVDAYERPNGDVSKIRQDLLDALNTGAIVVNFTGHGTELSWTGEEILTIQTVKDLDNSEKLPLFVTATCEFGRFDDPSLVSGAEALFMSRAGAIGLVTTTRPVYASSNFTINKAFYDELFLKENGKYRSLGDVFRATKNASLNSVFNRNFSLLADPSIHINLPEREIVFDKINNDSVTSFEDTISLGEPFNLKLSVISEDGVVDTEFNGVSTLSFYEKLEEAVTKGDKGQTTATFTKTRELVYEVNVEVVNGLIEADLIIPVGINPYSRNMNIIAYAFSEEGIEASGALEKITMGGLHSSELSNNPTLITLIASSMNNDGQYDSKSEFEFELKDLDGISFSSLIIGKENYAVIDGDFDNKILVNDYMILVDGDSREAYLELPLDFLSQGDHTLELFVFDSFGTKSSSGEILFTVGASTEVFLYPSPVFDELFLNVKRSNVDLDFSYEVVIYSIYGQEIFNLSGVGEKELDFNKKLISMDSGLFASGVYNYFVTLRYNNGSSLYEKGQFTKL